MPTINLGGMDIYYVEHGAGEVLLVFPDHLHAASAYDGEMAYFADRYRVIAFDYPGRGRSTREMLYADERTFDQWNHWSDLACHLLIELEIERAFLLGVGGGWSNPRLFRAQADLFLSSHSTP